ncbi:UAA transporter family protein [Cooperia oncophora]
MCQGGQEQPQPVHSCDMVYLKIVVIFFIVNLCNNYAIKCDIYFPLFIIFKSGSLLANIIFGFVLRNHYYTRKQISSVIAVTCGIVIFTLASYDPTTNPKTTGPAWFFSIQPFFIGVFLLTAALMLSAYLGVCQEDMYRTYGKHAKESMFMVHFLSIPGYALLGDEIIEAFYAANRTPSMNILGYDLLLPTAWGYILGICVLQ